MSGRDPTQRRSCEFGSRACRSVWYPFQIGGLFDFHHWRIAVCLPLRLEVTFSAVDLNWCCSCHRCCCVSQTIKLSFFLKIEFWPISLARVVFSQADSRITLSKPWRSSLQSCSKPPQQSENCLFFVSNSPLGEQAKKPAAFPGVFPKSPSEMRDSLLVL